MSLNVFLILACPHRCSVMVEPLTPDALSHVVLLVSQIVVGIKVAMLAYINMHYRIICVYMSMSDENRPDVGIAVNFF